MVILKKVVNSIEELEACMVRDMTCADIKRTMIKIFDGARKKSDDPTPNYYERKIKYDYIVSHALDLCNENIPSPFSTAYPSCYGITLGNDFFTLRIPNEFGFGVKVLLTKTGIKYEASIVFYNNKLFVEESEYYNSLINDGWEVKEKK